jgi:hypothetical protein
VAKSGELSTKQRRAVAALLTSATVEQAAQKAQIGHRTLTRWLAENEPFRTALANAEADLVSQAARSIAAGAVESVAILRSIQLDGNATNREKIQAGAVVLGNMPKLRLLGSLEAAIEELQRVKS